VVIAMTVLAIGALAFATSTSNGLELVGTAKGRQTAVQVANEWMEDARGLPYESIALDSATAFEGAGTPDAAVSGGTYHGAAGDEALVLASGSPLRHTGTDARNGTEYTYYRYVTWVADGAAAQAYKRVTVVVQWDAAGVAPKQVVQSTVLSVSGLGWSSTTTTTPAAPTTTTTAVSVPTTTTTVAGPCTGDVTAPTGTMTILAGTGANTGYTSSSTVTLSLGASDPCAPLKMAFSNDGTNWSVAEAFSTVKAWQLAAGNGNRTLRVRFTDGAGNAAVASANVRVDATAPTTPGAFSGATAQSPRRVVLQWSPSTDNDQLIGYRIYRADGNGSFQNQSTGVSAPCSTSPCSWTDTTVLSKGKYTYYVVAYDAAGNESTKTADVTLKP
jgi:hypothetical protein